MASPPRYWPSRFSLENYRELANFGEGVTRYLWNSGSIALMTVVATLVISTLAGYGFSLPLSRSESPVHADPVDLDDPVPVDPQPAVHPVARDPPAGHETRPGARLYDVPAAVRGVHDAQLLRRGAARNRSAVLDGCRPLSMLRRVMLPLVGPGLATVSLFAFFGSWNELLAALILISDARQFTLPVMLLNAQSGQLRSMVLGPDAGRHHAGHPALRHPFLLLQRHYIHGLVAGAVKA